MPDFADASVVTVDLLLDLAKYISRERERESSNIDENRFDQIWRNFTSL